ncbi:MAG: hypothetical protein ABI696_05630 [Rubrivivax sp.]
MTRTTRTALLRRSALAAITAVGLLAAGVAQARDDRPDVRWSLSFGVPFGAPFAGVTVGNGDSYYGAAPVYGPSPYYGTTPHYGSYYDAAPSAYWPAPRRVVVVPRHDRDRDGIPNRWDRRYNPRWDRDGDGVPNRRDRHPNRPDRRDGRDWHGR